MEQEYMSREAFKAFLELLAKLVEASAVTAEDAARIIRAAAAGVREI